jgi:hypothetical protein
MAQTVILLSVALFALAAAPASVGLGGMKDFQQQYTNWFNRTRPRGRRGRLWADRFKSVILESGRAVWECD